MLSYTKNLRLIPITNCILSVETLHATSLHQAQTHTTTKMNINFYFLTFNSRAKPAMAHQRCASARGIVAEPPKRMRAKPEIREGDGADSPTRAQKKTSHPQSGGKFFFAAKRLAQIIVLRTIKLKIKN